MSTHAQEKHRIAREMRTHGFNVEVVEQAGADCEHLHVRWKGGPIARVRFQIRDESAAKHYAQFRVKRFPKGRKNHFFLFRSIKTGETWLMSADECSNETKEKETTVINFHGKRESELSKFKAGNFDRLKRES